MNKSLISSWPMPSRRKIAQKITAGSLVGVGAFDSLLRLWDWITTGDSLMSIYEHLPSAFSLLNHPTSPIVCLTVGFGILWWVTRDDPKPVMLYGANYHQPLPIKKHPVFAIATISAVSALILATIYLGFHQHFGQPKTENAPESLAVPVPPEVKRVDPPHTSTPHVQPDSRLVNTPRSSAPTGSSTTANSIIGGVVPAAVPQAVPSSPSLQKSAGNIPAPPELANSPSSTPSTTPPKAFASIDGKPIRASDKKPGTIYVSARLAELTRYRGVDQPKIDAALSALKKVEWISVFQVTGAFNLNLPTVSYGLGGIAAAKARHIYYFDDRVADACKIVRDIVAESIGQMSCEKYMVPLTDASEINLPRDFLALSGLDMEIIF